MSDRQPYSRVYWSVFDDERFATIRGDVRHFGSWTTMLLVADMAYPSSAFIPPTIPRASVKALIDAGLIEPQPGGMFRLHGLQAERSRRADAARRGPNREADGTQPEPEGASRRDETSKDEPSPAKEGNGAAPDSAPRRETPRQQVYRWLQEHGASNPTGWVIKALDELIKVYGPETITGLWATAPSDVRTSKQFVQYAERNLSPAIHGKTQGHTRTAQEGLDAFDS